MDYGQIAELISNDLRLKTAPIGVKFLKTVGELPEKVRRPSSLLGKRITICQAVTMARVYRWSLGLTREDLICVPAMITFGFTRAPDQYAALGKVFCGATFQKDQQSAVEEAGSMSLLENREFEAIALAPLQKAPFVPDVAAIYGNPAQIMRLIQGWVYHDGKRVPGNFGGKVECTEYLIAAFKTEKPRVSIPGMGDRIFSMTQDDEMVFSLPSSDLEGLAEGLKEAGKKIGARYPITFYQNFQPEFPELYKKVGEEVKAFSD